MRIAAACKSETKTGHFGFCGSFAVYEFRGGFDRPSGMTVLTVGAGSGVRERAELLASADAAMVLCDGISPDAANALLELGIMPVAGWSGEPEAGAIGALNGSVPLTPPSCGSCGGDCKSGCGGK